MFVRKRLVLLGLAPFLFLSLPAFSVPSQPATAFSPSHVVPAHAVPAHVVPTNLLSSAVTDPADSPAAAFRTSSAPVRQAVSKLGMDMDPHGNPGGDDTQQQLPGDGDLGLDMDPHGATGKLALGIDMDPHGLA